MSTILISTIGKQKKNNINTYDELTYRFDQEHEYKGTFFLLALKQFFNDTNTRIDKIVLLGTNGSMWDALLECTDMEDSELLETLPAAVQNENVSEDLLKKLDDALHKSLGVQFICKIIPSGADLDEQAKILTIIASEVFGKKDHVIMDVTHGYRSLPMLELLAVFYLNQALDVKIDGIYYGARDMGKINESGQFCAPVIRLDFILQMQKWLNALPLVTQGGRYDAIAELLTDQEPLQDTLKKLSLAQHLNQIENAVPEAKRLQELLQHPFANNPSAELFRQPLLNSIHWVTAEELPRQMLLNASIACRQGDYLRSVILIQEARVSMHLKPKDYHNLQLREEAKVRLNSCTEKEDEILDTLRNVLAHATVPDKKNRHLQTVETIIQDEEALKGRIEHLIEYYMEKQKELNENKDS